MRNLGNSMEHNMEHNMEHSMEHNMVCLPVGACDNRNYSEIKGL